MNAKDEARKQREAEKAEKMKDPDWQKYSGWPPPKVATEAKPKKKAKAQEPAENGDSN